MKHTSMHRSEMELDADAAWNDHADVRESRPSPGKVSLTSRLIPGPRTPAIEPVIAPPASAAPDAAHTAAWMNAAVRPDLYAAPDAAPVQRKSANGKDEIGGDAGSRGSGSGQALPEDVRTDMEGFFGMDLGAVRVHQGPRAPAIGARAFTQGTEIHFAPGEYDPGSQRGRELLGHELTHVMQQRQGRVRATAQAKGMGINSDASLEREADALGAQAARSRGARNTGRPASLAPSATASAPVQRSPFNTAPRYAEPTLPDGVGIPAFTPLYDVNTKKEVGKLAYEKFAAVVSEDKSFRTVRFKNDIELQGAAPAPSGEYLVAVAESGKPVYNSAATPLFPHEPKVEDVVQGKIGDCYLLAAVISLVNSGPKFIQSMMQDNGDGTVSVRLYRDGNPEYMKIAKDTVQVAGKDFFAKGSLWVQMIEKAYAAAGFQGRKSKDQPGKTHGSPGHQFADIQGGTADHAFEVLTGKSPDSKNITSKVDTRDTAFKAELVSKLDRGHASALPALKGLTNEEWDNVQCWFARAKGPLEKYLAALQKDRGDKKKAATELTWEWVHDHYVQTRHDYNSGVIDRYQVPDHMANLILRELDGWLKSIVGGATGSGDYSQLQLDLFQEIDDGLHKNGKVLSLSTNASLGPKTATGPNGEAVTDGMLGGHAYAVLATKVDASNKRWIQLKDPYARFARDYGPDGKAREAADPGGGVFWVELSELTRDFSSLRTGAL